MKNLPSTSVIVLLLLCSCVTAYTEPGRGYDSSYYAPAQGGYVPAPGYPAAPYPPQPAYAQPYGAPPYGAPPPVALEPAQRRMSYVQEKALGEGCELRYSGNNRKLEECLNFGPHWHDALIEGCKRLYAQEPYKLRECIVD